MKINKNVSVSSFVSVTLLLSSCTLLPLSGCGGGGGYTNPTPTPTPAPTATPNATPTPSATPVPGQLNQLTITREGTDAHNNKQNGAVNVKIYAEGGIKTGYLNMICSDPAQNALYGITIQVLTQSKPLATGTFPADFVANNPKVSFIYQEYGAQEIPATTTRSWGNYKAGVASEGNIIIEQVDANKVRVRFENVLMHPQPFQNSTGNIRVNGTFETTTKPAFVD